MRNKILYLFLIFFINSYLFADNIPQLFHTITVKDGLSGNMINTLCKDRTGFLWIGTQYGLDRFDGYEVKSYEAFQNTYISDVKQLKKSSLLIGTDGGLFLFDQVRESKELIKLDEYSVNVQKIYVINGEEEHFLVCTSMGLYEVKQDVVTKKLFETGISSVNYIHAVVKGKKDTYWFATRDGLCKYNLLTGDEQVYRIKTDIVNHNYFTDLDIDGSVLYVGSLNQGVSRFLIEEEQFISLPEFEKDYIKTVTVGEDSLLYVTTDGKGLKVWNSTTSEIQSMVKVPGDIYSISSNTICSFLIDNGIYWIGTYSQGLSYNMYTEDFLKPYTFSGFNSLNYNVRSVFVMDTNDKLIGTRNGFIFISEESREVSHFTNESHRDVLRSDIILTVYPWENRFLIGTYGGGMSVFDPEKKTLTNFRNEHVFINGAIMNMVSDGEGALWISSNEGIIKYKEGKIKQYTVNNSSLPDNLIRRIYNDSNDRLWITCPQEAGLYILDKKNEVIKAVPFSKEYESLLRKTNYITEDQEGNIWICSLEGILRCSGNFTDIVHFTTDHFLPELSVLSILETPDGHLWFTTLNYVIKYNKKSGRAELFKSPVSEDSIFNLGSQLQNGYIWWCNERGLLYSNIYCMPFNSIPVITSLVFENANQEEINTLLYADKRLQATIADDEFSIGFSYLNYFSPYSNIYEYKLEGYEEEWKMTTDNKLSYTGLKPGKYQFTLRNPHSSEIHKNIEIKIRNPYHWAYYSAGIFVLLIIGVGFILYRRKPLHQVAGETEKQGIDKSPAKRNIQVTPEQAEKIRQVLIEEMEKNKPYLNPEIKINDVAKSINSTPVELSQVLNIYTNSNFTDFINKYRFEEFKSYLSEDILSKYSLNGISEKCGFNSRSTFYRAVKKITGLSPVEYVEQQGFDSMKK